MLTETFDVFISYSHHDVDWVKDWLLPRFELAGLKVCIDFRDFDIGIPSLTNMENAVERSQKTLLVMTPNWVKSEWTNFESLLIQTEDPSGVRQRTLPLMLEKCELPKRLGIFTHADFTEKTQWDHQLARVISAISGKPTAPTSARSILQPNLVHPYPLQANFTGRVKEREELTEWLADEEHPIYELVAMGGMGKSALTWYWLTRDVLPSADAKLDGAIWWSFYEGESSFAKFIDEAVKYVSHQPIDDKRFPTTYDRAQELLRLLQTKRILFVLDGFERQLRDYAGLNAAYKSDSGVAPSRESRACLDPIASRLLREIAAGITRARVLITTRLPVSDLQDRAGAALAGVLETKLEQLSRNDALKFMRAQGVTKGTAAEIAKACEAYGYHSLSLRLLSVLVARDTKMPGDISAAPSHDVHDDLIQRQHHILQRSYDALPKRLRALLSRISAFRGPMGYGAVSIFNTLGTEQRFDEGLEELMERGLLHRDDYGRYDLHPIVRHYAYDRLADKIGVHTRLRDYFSTIPIPAGKDILSIEDLAPVIELYHHTVGAGLYDDAYDLLSRQLVPHPLHYRFGAYQLIIELDVALFPDGDGQPPRLKKESDSAWILGSLGNSYGLSGQLRRALSFLELDLALRSRLEDSKAPPISLWTTAYLQVELGELRAADLNLRRFIDLCRETTAEFHEAGARCELGRLLAYRGAFDEAGRELLAAQAVFDRRYTTVGPNNFVAVVRAALSHCFLLMGDLSSAQAMAHESRKRADDFYAPVERDFIVAEFLLSAALVIEGRDLSGAATHLTEALTRCRRTNLVEFEPDILLTWARWYRARDNAQEAQAHADEALVIADRCEYRLKQAEIHNFLARLAIDAGSSDQARHEAKIAKERAWCDGPPHCYKPALDEAEEMLKELGAKE